MDYSSSEEIQRQHSADVFARAESERQKVDLTEKEKLKKLLDTHIARYSSTKSVREMAKEHSRSADYQLDLSADIVDVLEKIKSELR